MHKIWTISAEAAPFAKTGGLADVVGSLPKALAALGEDVRVVMPAYQSIEDAYRTGRHNLKALPGEIRIPTGSGSIPIGVFEGRLPGSEVPVYFIAERQMFGRPNIYGYADDAYRFAFFSRAALELARALDFHPDVVHSHDWHAAPAITWLATAGTTTDWFRNIPTVYSIHNLAYQGKTNWNVFNYLGLLTHRLNEEGYDEVNFMARGIAHASLINTVSPTYAREIMTPEGGAGLDGLLRHRGYDVHGILNGLDYTEWNPQTDRYLAQPFDADHLEDRLTNKRALQARAGLPQRDDVPLVAMVTRLDWQKGLDITGHVIHLLLNGYAGEAQFVVLGTGAPEYEQMLAQITGYHREKSAAFLTYAADLAPMIYGGSDIFLMPSRFEPCGLGQLIAMRYGSVPVVRATGGLADTVQPGVTGFSFVRYSSQDFWEALQFAIGMYRANPTAWRSLQRNGMQADFSWQRSAYGYQQLYTWAVARARG
ncbi:MAG: glycogen synthase [Anaerolineae bacterium]